MRLKSRNKGFTVVELAMTLIIVALLIVTGVPAFSGLIQDNRIVTETNLLVGSLNLARSEAIKRNTQVSISSASGTNNVWESGWTVFTDADGDGILDDDGDANICEPGIDADCVLQVQSALAGGITLRSNGGYTTYFAFLPTGFIEGAVSNSDEFFLCGSDADTSMSRTVALNVTGRPQTSKGTTSCP